MKRWIFSLLCIAALPAWAQNVGGEFKLTGLWADSAAKSLVAVGYSGNEKQSSVIVSEDSGKTWALRASLPNQLVDIWGSSVKDLFAVGNGGLVMRSVDNGKTWETQTTGTTEDLLSVWGSSNKDVYAVGKSGTILHTSDAGKTWEAKSYGKKFTLRSVWGTSAKDVYICGTQGVVIRSSDGGKTWTDAKSGIKESLKVIAGTKKDIYAIADRSTIIHSSDQGASWDIYVSAATDAEGLGDAFTAILVTDKGAQVYTQRGVALVSKDKGKSWDETKTKNAKGISEIIATPKIVWAVAEGSVISSEDGGITWKSVIDKSSLASK